MTDVNEILIIEIKGDRSSKSCVPTQTDESERRVIIMNCLFCAKRKKVRSVCGKRKSKGT